MKKEDQELLNKIGQILYDKKGFNILAMDVEEVSTLTRFFVLAEGNVDRHVIAMAKNIVEELKKEGHRPIHVEGLEIGDWVVLDFMDVVIHLFTPGMREQYRLESLWNQGEVVDLDIDIGSENTKVS